MGCGGSSLQDLSNQAKTAVSQAKDTAQANGLEKVDLGKASRKKSPEMSGIFPKRGGGESKEDHFPYFL